MTEEQYVGSSPEDFVAGGFLDDTDVDIVKSRFVMFDYNGKLPEPIPALAVTYKTDEGNEHTQNYKAGNAKDFIPSKDGSGLLPTGRNQFIKNTNFHIYVIALRSAGFDNEEANKGNWSVLEGLRVHVVQQAAPKREGTNQKEDATILVVSEILEKTSKTSKTSKTDTKKTTDKKTEESPTVDNADLETKATEFLMEKIVAAGDKGYPKRSIPVDGMQHFKDDPNKTAIVGKLFEDAFLASLEGITYENGVMKLTG